MQIILEDENEKDNSGGIDLMDFIICIGRISGCVERKYVRRFRGKENRI